METVSTVQKKDVGAPGSEQANSGVLGRAVFNLLTAPVGL